jgi:hypothetical protein
MTSARPILLLALVLALPAWGQDPSDAPPEPSAPDDSWSGYPPANDGAAPAEGQLAPGQDASTLDTSDDDGPPPTPLDEDWSNPGFRSRAREVPAPLPRLDEEDAELEQDIYVRPEEPNEVSLFAGPALGQGRLAAGAAVGFPFLGARVAYGVLPRLDLGAQVETVYGALTDVRAMARFQLAGAISGWALGVVADGGPAFFVTPAPVERRGLRWLTGRRNWNLTAGMVVSYQGPGAKASRVFVDARAAAALDTEPFQRDPLGGVPAAVQLSWNVPVRFGAEIPYSRWTSLLFTFGFDVHTRPDDAVVMPALSLGLVTSLF